MKFPKDVSPGPGVGWVGEEPGSGGDGRKGG